MSLAVVACALLLVPVQQTTRPDLATLRWVRATVSAATPDAITLRLKDSELILTRDLETEIAGPDPAAGIAVGSVVEAHYADRQGVRRASVIVADPGPGNISKRPGSSLRGSMVRFGRGTIWLGAGARTRDLSVEKKSRLLDRDGRPLAAGSAAIALLSPNDDLLVKIEGSSIMVGDLDLGGDNAVEIRRLR